MGSGYKSQNLLKVQVGVQVGDRASALGAVLADALVEVLA